MHLRARAFAITIAAVAWAAGAAADDTFAKVIPPGAEKLVGAMVGDGATLPAKCTLDRASIDRDRIVAAYACDGRAASIVLVHPSDHEASGAVAKTEKFALLAGADVPKPLVDAVAASVSAHEKDWHWISAEAPGLGTPADAPAAPTDPSTALTPEQSEVFLTGVRQYRAARYQQAFETFRGLARTVPQNGVLGMVVASLASTSPTADVVDRFTAEADAHLDDTLAQFVAGVASHYCGHLFGRTREEKASYYARAIKYLSRTRPKFDFEPRVFVYLAVSHFRLGHQAEAEQLIESAVPLAKNDPDVYYCRGEIFQRTNLARSIADIRKYLDMSTALEKQGVAPNSAKLARVETMLAHLEAVEHGAAQPDDLFDPLYRPSVAPAPPPNRFFTSPATFGGAALLAGAVTGCAWLVVERRRRARGA
jgi:hypothetical protein